MTSLLRSLFASVCPAAATQVACVGDSNTFGFRGIFSPPTEHNYPRVLQRALGEEYEVVNLGSSGATLCKSGRDGQGEYIQGAAYWDRDVFKTLLAGKWDAVVIMLGTNDCKQKASGSGVDNWPGEQQYAADYAELIRVVRALGTPAERIFVCTPAPCMQDGAFGLSAHLVNDVLPAVVPRVAAAAGVEHIDIFAALGGGAVGAVPPTGVTLAHRDANPDPGHPAMYFVDETWNDQVHCCDKGYAKMAETIADAIRARR